MASYCNAAADMRELLHAPGRLARTVWTPSRVFEEIGDRPTWLGAFLIVGLGSAAIVWIALPIAQKGFLISLAESLSSEQLERITQTHRTIRYVYTGGAVLGTLVFWFLSAFLIWLLVQVFEGRSGFRAIFSVVSHGSVVSLISGILVLVLVLVKAQREGIDPQSLEVRLGADLLVEGTVHPSLKLLLANLNPFSLWYYGLLTVGVATVSGFSRVRSMGVVGVFWMLSMAFGAGTAWVASVFTTPTPSF